MASLAAYTFPLLELADDLRLSVCRRLFAASVVSALSLCAACRFLRAELDDLRSRAVKQLQWHVCTHELDATVVLGYTTGPNWPCLDGKHVLSWTIHLGIPSLWDNIVIGICAQLTDMRYGEPADRPFGPEHEWAHGWGLSPKCGMLLRVPARLGMLPLGYLPTGNMLRLLPPNMEIDNITIIWDADHGTLGFRVNGGSPFTATSFGRQEP